MIGDELGQGGQNGKFSVDLNEALLFVFSYLECVSNCNLCRFEMSVVLLPRGWKPTGCGVAARLWRVLKKFCHRGTESVEKNRFGGGGWWWIVQTPNLGRAKGRAPGVARVVKYFHFFRSVRR